MSETMKKPIEMDTSTRIAYNRTRLAYENTMMAWVRTATSLIAFGFSAYDSIRDSLLQRGPKASDPWTG